MTNELECPACANPGNQIMETNKAILQCMNDDCKVSRFFHSKKRNGKY